MQSAEVLLIAAGVALLALSFWLGKRGQERAESRIPRQIVSGLSPESAVRLQTSLTELLHELHTLSRDVTVDLEQKLSELKELLQMADTKLEELSSAHDRERDIEDGLRGLQPNEDGPADSPESEFPAAGEDEDVRPPSSNRYQQIYQMADNGFPLDEIARSVQMGKGEIQLILSLRSKD